MEWVALITWGLVMTVALPLGVGAVIRPEFALAAMLAGAGFVLTLLWVIIEGNKWPLWAATGCGGLALVAVGIGSLGLVSSDRAYGSDRLQFIAESVAGLAAAQLFLLLYVTLFTGAAALGATAS